jgi:hypothetical protein
VPDEPTDDELIAFAESILGKLGDSLRESAMLRETIIENRLLWRTLYTISGEMEDEGR